MHKISLLLCSNTSRKWLICRFRKQHVCFLFLFKNTWWHTAAIWGQIAVHLFVFPKRECFSSSTPVQWFFFRFRVFFEGLGERHANSSESFIDVQANFSPWELVSCLGVCYKGRSWLFTMNFVCLFDIAIIPYWIYIIRLDVIVVIRVAVDVCHCSASVTGVVALLLELFNLQIKVFKVTGKTDSSRWRNWQLHFHIRADSRCDTFRCWTLNGSTWKKVKFWTFSNFQCELPMNCFGNSQISIGQRRQ